MIPFAWWLLELIFGELIIALLESIGASSDNLIRWAVTNPLLSSIALFFLVLTFLIILAYFEALDEIDISFEPVELHKDTYASIKVRNNRADRSVFCTPYLHRIVWDYNPSEKIDITDTIESYNKELSWDGGSDSPEVEIRPNKHKFINVARFIGNDIVFTYHGVDTKHASGKFRIWVNVLCRTDIENPRYFERHFFGCFETYASVAGTPLSSIRIWTCEEVSEWKREAGIGE
jgi:hypothetical protein